MRPPKDPNSSGYSATAMTVMANDARHTPGARLEPAASSRSRTTTLLRAVGCLGIVAVAMALKLQLLPTHRYLPWHGTPEWWSFLDLYDHLVMRSYLSYPECKSEMVETDFGLTHSIACGSPDQHPVVWLHGTGGNALFYADWIVPNLLRMGSDNPFYCVIPDYPCDIGRSVPPGGGNPNLCPQTQEDLATWVGQVLEKLNVTQQASSIVGYSYGALVAFATARHRPSLVHKLVLLAPGGVLDSVSWRFLARALVFVLFRSEPSQAWFWRWLSSDPDWSFAQYPEDVQAQLHLAREVAATTLAVPPDEAPDHVLHEVFRRHPTFVGVGEKELVLTNATRVAERSRSAGATRVKVYAGVGHLMLFEAADDIARDTIEFLLQP